MSFNVENMLEGILKEVRELMGDDWPKIESALKTVLNDEKEALQDIANARINGEITDEEVKEQLEYEKDAFIAGISMVSAIKKSTMQRIVNLATDLIITAIASAL